ncbi:hypothetical protein [Tardiphaga sp. 862_B3_N1_1]|uniref:hypothetical protein n=1 Tax=Tardiphaga sp. 862_B3_N1_1 TaxID=3240763 RepID=UPI003F8A8B7D
MTTYAEQFSANVKKLEEDARAAGTNLTQICKATGIARVTVERWKSRAPQTVHKLDELKAEVERVKAKRAEVTPA